MSVFGLMSNSRPRWWRAFALAGVGAAAQTRPGTAPAPRQLPTGDQLLATTALDTSHAWVLFGGPKGHGDSYLYATNDAGGHWHQIAVFGWPR